jgi:hypothetical protein
MRKWNTYRTYVILSVVEGSFHNTRGAYSEMKIPSCVFRGDFRDLICVWLERSVMLFTIRTLAQF